MVEADGSLPKTAIVLRTKDSAPVNLFQMLQHPHAEHDRAQRTQPDALLQ